MANLHQFFVKFGVLAVSYGLPPTLLAEWKFAPSPGVAASSDLLVSFAAVSTPGANLGRGRVDPDTGLSEEDPTWGEAAVEPALHWSTTGIGEGSWYGHLSAAGAITFGDGDPGGFTAGGDGQFDVEGASVGWRSAPIEIAPSRPVFDVSVGRQELNIGDGFLIDDGNFDFRDDGGVWLVPRQAFQRTAIGRMDYRALHLDAFFLEADPDHDETAVAGVNLEHRFAANGHLGLLYFHVVDSDRPTLFGARHGMNVTSVRVNDFHLPQWSQVAMWGEYTRESGSGRNGGFDASAWYGEVIYTFQERPWTPSLSYRYAYFSGDANANDTTRRDFDGFFYGFDKRGWGTWFQGEVTGGWLLFNSNQQNHLVKLSGSPNDSLTVGLIGGTYHLAESHYLGIPVTDDHFGDEINVYADWLLNDRISISAGYGVLFPGDAAIQAFGDDQRYHILELGIYLNF